eukprot:scaffold89913_cov31-Tisochrysis_lutea.AAC.2
MKRARCSQELTWLESILLERGVAERLCSLLRLVEVTALAQSTVASALLIGRLVESADFWRAHDSVLEGSHITDFLVSVARHLHPAETVKMILRVEQALQSGMNHRALREWYILLERPNALSWILGQIIYSSTAVWRPSDLAHLFWAFWPDDGGFPQDEANAKQLSNHLVHLCQSAHVRDENGQLRLTSTIKAVLSYTSASIHWASSAKAAFVACSLIKPEPCSGTFDVNKNFGLVDVIPMGLRFGLQEQDLLALQRLVVELSEMEEYAHPNEAAIAAKAGSMLFTTRCMVSNPAGICNSTFWHDSNETLHLAHGPNRGQLTYYIPPAFHEAMNVEEMTLDDMYVGFVLWSFKATAFGGVAEMVQDTVQIRKDVGGDVLTVRRIQGSDVHVTKLLRQLSEPRTFVKADFALDS